jgi:DNA primase
LRALEAAVPVHPGVRVAICPEGLDPDSWIRQAGADRVREALAAALTPLQYLEERSRAEGWSGEETLGRVAKLLRGVEDPMVRDLWIQEAAGRFRVREQAIWSALGPRRAGIRTSSEQVEKADRERTLPAKERQIIAGAVQSPAMAGVLFEACREIPEISATCKRLLEWIRQRSADGIIDAAPLLSRASEEGEEVAGELSFLHEETAQMDQVPADLVRRLKRWNIQRKMQDLTDRIRRVEEGGGATEELLLCKQELARELRDLDAT